MFTLRTAFLSATISLALALPEGTPATLALKVGDIALKKPNAGSTFPIQSEPLNESAALNQFSALKLRQSSGCCDCLFESHNLDARTVGGIDYGDNDPHTINSWITHPYSNLGCGGHSYTAFNVYGLGYGRWEYDHTDIQFYMNNQFNVPGGSRIIQWGAPQVGTSEVFSDFSYNTKLFTAYVIDASNYVVLDSCPCYSRAPAKSTWECVPPERCCYGAECSEDLNFQCGPCNSLG